MFLGAATTGGRPRTVGRFACSNFIPGSTGLNTSAGETPFSRCRSWIAWYDLSRLPRSLTIISRCFSSKSRPTILLASAIISFVTSPFSSAIAQSAAGKAVAASPKRAEPARKLRRSKLFVMGAGDYNQKTGIEDWGDCVIGLLSNLNYWVIGD